MSFFIYIAFTVAITSAFSHTVGYTVFEFKEGATSSEFLYEHKFEDGEDLLYDQYLLEGRNVTKSEIIELADNYKFLSKLLAQIFSIVLMSGILYGTLWDLGNKERAEVNRGVRIENKKKGLICGTLATIPFFIIFILLVLSKAQVFSPEFLGIYRGVNYHLFTVISWIYGSAKIATDLSVIKIILLGLLNLYLPVICSIAYYLGYEDFSIVEHTVFKKLKRRRK